MIKELIKKEIDACIEGDVNETLLHIQQCYSLIIPYLQASYENSRDIIQFCIGQFQRISNVSGVIQLALAMDKLQSVSPLFGNHPSKSLDYQNVAWDGPSVRCLLERLAPCLSGGHLICSPKMEIADILTSDERRLIVSFILDSVQHFGIQTLWDKATIDHHLFNCSILYPICKKDCVMDLFFFFCYNVLDRLNGSGEHQLARDFAESLLMIGHNEDAIPESYFGACRAYTLANNNIAGLLYLNIALENLKQRKNPIPQRFAYEILWQMLKIMREHGCWSPDYITVITDEFDKLDCHDYDKLSIYHTAFSTRATSNDRSIMDSIADFLDKNREMVFRNIEHSAMPWLTLIDALKTQFPDADHSSLRFYERAFLANIERDGNELLLDLIENRNLSSHLKELLAKLQSTRERGDYSKDNRMALVYAKRLLSQATEQENPEDYLLAMQPKSDFTFVIPKNIETRMYRKVEVEDVDGEELSMPYLDIEMLKLLLQTDDSDAVMWVGKGSHHYSCMILLRDGYSIETLEGWHEIDVMQLQLDVISGLRFIKETYAKGESVYVKSKTDLEQESLALLQSLEKCTLQIPTVASRLFFVKDLEISAFPHQLIIDSRSEQFIGEILPSANIISTELFIKTNFEEPLPKDYSKSFWSPVDSGELTFSSILACLDTIFQDYSFDVHCEITPAYPLHSDLNVICAHGGRNISETEWFYANETPLIESDRIVTKGKLLILFVCHAGTITRNEHDNAMHTIVKRYLQMGYSSVVAPMWSLPTTILSTWLSSFLVSMDAGDYVVDAVFNANMVVKDEFVAPSAWACLHLYGNPYLRIGEKARLSLVLDDEHDK